MYFLTGNIWLMVWLALMLGRNEIRTSPTMYSFFGVGAWLEPSTYQGFTAVTLGAACVSFVLGLRNRKKAAESD